MNEISIHGNLGRNPECTYTASGVAIAKFSVAVSSRRFDKNRGEWVSRPTVWHDVVAFGKLAENAADTLTKGVTVTVAGTLADDSYTRESREPGGEDIVIRRTQLEAFDIAVSLRNATATVTRNERGEKLEQRVAPARGGARRADDPTGNETWGATPPATG